MSAEFTSRALGWDEFLEQALPEARTLMADRSPPGIERYLAALADAAARTDPAGVPVPERFNRYRGYPDDVGFALTRPGTPFLAVQFEVQPGGRIPYHPHFRGSVCTLFLEGSALVRNFSFVETPTRAEPDWKSSEPLLLRHDGDEWLTPGRVNLVGNPRANIHGFHAGPEGARGIDLTSLHLTDEPAGDGILEIEERATDPARGLHRAHWRGE